MLIYIYMFFTHPITDPWDWYIYIPSYMLLLVFWSVGQYSKLFFFLFFTLLKTNSELIPETLNGTGRQAAFFLRQKAYLQELCLFLGNIFSTCLLLRRFFSVVWVHGKEKNIWRSEGFKIGVDWEETPASTSAVKHGEACQDMVE